MRTTTSTVAGGLPWSSGPRWPRAVLLGPGREREAAPHQAPAPPGEAQPFSSRAQRRQGRPSVGDGPEVWLEEKAGFPTATFWWSQVSWFLVKEGTLLSPRWSPRRRPLVIRERSRGTPCGWQTRPGQGQETWIPALPPPPPTKGPWHVTSPL